MLYRYKIKLYSTRHTEECLEMKSLAIFGGKKLKTFTVYYHVANSKDDCGFVNVKAFDEKDAENAFYDEMPKSKFLIQEIELNF